MNADIVLLIMAISIFSWSSNSGNKLYRWSC